MLVSQESHQEIWACFGWEMEWRPWGSKVEAESRAGGEFAELWVLLSSQVQSPQLLGVSQLFWL